MKSLLLGAFLLSSQSFADINGAYLDAPYKNLVHPKVDTTAYKQLGRSNVEALISKMTSVKAQGSRGTCSMFSAAGMLESMLIIKRGFSKNIDLSEEFLEYVIMAKSNRTSDGSNSFSNFMAIRQYGMPTEATLPYLPENWEKNQQAPIVIKRCGSLLGDRKKTCLLGHHNPDHFANLAYGRANLVDDKELVLAWNEAKRFKARNIKFSGKTFQLRTVSQIKSLLNNGIPITLGISFYYGAWNHSKAPSFGMTRNMNNWSKGIVGYPERGSKDRQVSEKKENLAGHSFIIVGYDNNKYVTTTSKMLDGTTKTFNYKGVYYFKNSWGTGGFGNTFSTGREIHDGYGMITMKHAHEHGSFYQLPLL